MKNLIILIFFIVSGLEIFGNQDFENSEKRVIEIHCQSYALTQCQ